MNERLLVDPKPARKLNAGISPELEEILFRALERDPRHRYATAAEMAWELEHQEQVGVDEGARRAALRQRLPDGPKDAALCGAGAGAGGAVCGDAVAGEAVKVRASTGQRFDPTKVVLFLISLRKMLRTIDRSSW